MTLLTRRLTEVKTPLGRTSVRSAIVACTVAGALGLTSVAQAANPTTAQLAKRTGLSQRQVEQAQASLDRGIAKMRHQVRIVNRDGRPTLRGPARYFRKQSYRLRLLPSRDRRQGTNTATASAQPPAIAEDCGGVSQDNNSASPYGYPYFIASAGYTGFCYVEYDYKHPSPPPSFGVLASANVSCADIGGTLCRGLNSPTYVTAGASTGGGSGASALANANWNVHVNGGNNTLACYGGYICDEFTTGAFVLVGGGSVAVAPRGWYFDPQFFPGSIGCSLQNWATQILCLGTRGTFVRVDAGRNMPAYANQPFSFAGFNVAGTG